MRATDPIAVTHRQWRPRYESRPYRIHPGRREHIYGRVQPADDLVSFGRRIPSGKIGVGIALLALLIFVVPLLGHTASRANTPGAVSSATFDRGSEVAHHG